MGDVVHAIPAAAALRQAFPDGRLHWLVDRRHREIVDLVTAIDRVIAVDGRSAGGWIAGVRALRQTPYAAAIDFQGLFKSAIFARASGAAQVVGFSIWHLREKTARPFYSTTGDVGQDHIIRRNLQLLRAINVTATEIAFPLAVPASAALDRLREQLPPNRPFALVNPAAAWPNKRWPPERLAAVAAFLAEECGMTPVVVWGPGEDALARSIASLSGGAALVAPATTVTDLVAMTRAAALIVSGDTGPLHIATAVGTRAVAIFGPTDPARNGPWSTEDVSVSRYDTCHCHYDRRCHHVSWCLADIPVAEVCAAIKQRLRLPAA